MLEETEVDVEAAASVPADSVESQEDQQAETPKTVPLAAFVAERKKRQEAESSNAYLKGRLEQASAPAEDQTPEDLSAPVDQAQLKEYSQLAKREIVEQVYMDSNPEAIAKIDKFLNAILEKKPWLAESVKAAPNRYARAHEIVNDYLHLVEPKAVVRQSSNQDGQKIIQNAQKPRSPVEIGKSATPGGQEYLKSVQGKKEFREYRSKLLKGEI